MRKGHIRHVVIHKVPYQDDGALVDKVNQFHVSLIERKLNQSMLLDCDKIIVIDKIIDDLKSREVNGIIQ